jgi:hypothetical protein
LYAAATVPLIATGLKAEEVMKGKEVNKGCLIRYPVRPLILGSLAAHSFMLAPIVFQAARTLQLATPFPKMVEKSLLPSLVLGTHIYLLTKAVTPATRLEDDNAFNFEDVEPAPWRENIKDTGKFTIGSAICLATAWISSYPTVTNAMLLGGLYVASIGLAQIQKNASASIELGLNPFHAGILTGTALVSTALLLPQIPLLSTWRFATIAVPSGINASVVIFSLAILLSK